MYACSLCWLQKVPYEIENKITVFNLIISSVPYCMMPDF